MRISDWSSDVCSSDLWLRETGSDGEVRVYGTPAEEGGSGKVYLVRAGAFDDVDVVLHWHPGDGNSPAQTRTLANISGTFRFTGVASPPATAPEPGRSAPDGVRAPDLMANRSSQRRSGTGCVCHVE